MKLGQIKPKRLSLFTLCWLTGLIVLSSCGGKNPTDQSLMALTMRINELSEPKKLSLPFEQHWVNARGHVEFIVKAMQDHAKAEAKDSKATLKETQVLDLQSKGFAALEQIALYLAGAQSFYNADYAKAALVKKAYLSADLIRILFYRSLLAYADEIEHLKKRADNSQRLDLSNKLIMMTETVTVRLEAAVHAINAVAGPWQDEFDNQLRRSIEEKYLNQLAEFGLRTVIEASFTQQAAQRAVLNRAEGRRAEAERVKVTAREAMIARLEKYQGKVFTPEEKATLRVLPEAVLVQKVTEAQVHLQTQGLKNIHINYLLTQPMPLTRAELEALTMQDLEKRTKSAEAKSDVDLVERRKVIRRIESRSIYFPVNAGHYNEFEFDGILFIEGDSGNLNKLPYTYLQSMRSRMEEMAVTRMLLSNTVDDILAMNKEINRSEHAVQDLYLMSAEELRIIAVRTYREMQEHIAQNGRTVPLMPLIAEARALPSQEECNDKIQSIFETHYKTLTSKDLMDLYQALHSEPPSRWPSIVTRAYHAYKMGEKYLDYRISMAANKDDFTVQEMQMVVDVTLNFTKALLLWKKYIFTFAHNWTFAEGVQLASIIARYSRGNDKELQVINQDILKFVVRPVIADLTLLDVQAVVASSMVADEDLYYFLIEYFDLRVRAGALSESEFKSLKKLITSDQRKKDFQHRWNTYGPN